MKKRIFWSICLSSLASVLLVGLCVLGILYNKIDNDTWQSLETEARYIAGAVDLSGEEYLDDVAGYAHRITLVAADGTVLYDDAEPAAGMENHADRPEVSAALTAGAGRATRYSETVGKRTFYYALRLAGGDVLRVSATVDTLWSETLAFVPVLLLACLAVVLVSMLLAHRLTKAVLRPINEVDLNQPLESKAYDELSPLLRRIEAGNREVKDTVAQLKQRQQEFNTITENLDEGMVVLNTEGVVLSINSAAGRILGTAGQAEGQLLVELNRDLKLDRAVGKAQSGQKNEIVLPLGERKFRVSATPALMKGEVNGVVLLLVDETEKLETETLRREFTANVSHELKTPLTSIAGYAEIMQKGIVKPEDIETFAGRIHEEAERLIALVGDIIKLSKLDEREVNLAPEQVDLLALARQTAEGIKEAAVLRGVQCNVHGEAACVRGVRSILSEILYNLCDNAIKYNREGGSVDISVWQEAETVYLRVQDTGAGIPADQQARVFERFFRGDTSHSSEISGTGLGLSIVKHGVAFHKGSIELRSTEGEGSTFTVTLPAAPKQ